MSSSPPPASPPAPLALYDRGVEEISIGAPVAVEGAERGGWICPVCNSPRALPRFRIEGLANRLIECPDCGLAWMAPMPSPEEIGTFYPPQYYGSNGEKFRGLIEGAIRLVGARRLRFLTSRLPRGAAVLDVGCGRGVLLRDLANRGYRVYRTERAPEAARGADPRAEIRFGDTLADVKFDANLFDQIIIWHVFEHLSNPRETLAEVYRILKPGGNVIIAVPNYSSWQARWSGAAWFHLDAPRHLFHFSTQAMSRLLTDSGFQVRSWHHFSLRQNPYGWVQSVLNKLNPRVRNGLYSWLLRGSASPEGISLGTRAWYLLAFGLGMPPATVLEMFAAVCRRGATFHVVATKPQPHS